MLLLSGSMKLTLTFVQTHVVYSKSNEPGNMFPSLNLNQVLNESLFEIRMFKKCQYKESPKQIRNN